MGEPSYTLSSNPCLHAKREGMIYAKREKESSKLRFVNGGAWSINLHRLPSHATQIEYITPVHTYEISRKDAFNNGFFRKLGGENKLVVPIKYWQVK